MLADVHDLRELGADMVIPEEYETSIEIFARVLDRYMVPTDKIEEFISIIRSENYEMFRTVSLPSSRIRMLRQSLSDMELSRIEVATYSKAAGKTISQLDIRKNHGATILAVNRGKEYIANPNAEFTIEAGDYLILIGKPEQIRNVAKDIRTPESPQKGSA
jgi:CPA2 family monovalent cation:H+ antiporter-2